MVLGHSSALYNTFKHATCPVKSWSGQFLKVCTNQEACLHSRGIRLSITLQEEANTFLMRPVRVETGHHHDLPGQVPHEAGRAEYRLAQPAKAFHHKAEGSL